MELSKPEDGYTYLLDWKKYVRPETIVIIDSDQSSYQAAAANERRTIKVTNKETQEVLEFKTRTEFWGRKKLSLGGWLADQNLQREVNGLSLYTKDDFIVEDVQTPQDVRLCLSNVKSKINHIMNHLGLTKYHCILGGENNFRLKLPAPEQYKSNRDDSIRPLQLADAREYIEKYHNAIVVDKIEADDKIAQFGYEGYLHFKEKGWFSHIIATFDKDNLTSPCLMFNTYSEEGTFKHPNPIFVDDGLGHLFLDKGKVKGQGFRFKCQQLLIGDPSDLVTPYQPFAKALKINFGETSSYKLLQPLTSKKECLEAVIKQYKEWFPNGVEFINHDGREIKMSAGQWLDVIYKMIHMKISDDDKSSLMQLIREVGAEY